MPSQIGPYQLTKTLGSGGQGQVKLGTIADGSQFAVKIMRLENSTPDLVESARIEATAMMAI